MKRILFFIVLSGIFVISAMGQYVTLEGKQFRDENGEDFFPVVCNYIVRVVNTDTTDFSTTYISQDKAWGPQQWAWDCSSTITCNAEIENDFKQILSMEFNTVRIMGLQPIFIREGEVVDSWDTISACDWVCPSTGFYLLSPGDTSGCINEKWFRFQSPYNDAASQRLFEHIENILKIASSTFSEDGKKLKIILVAGGARGNYSTEFPDAYSDYLSVLGDRISSIEEDSVKNRLLAYDLFNEPTSSWNWESLWPKVDTGHSKQDVCNNVREWYETLKAHDPDHLITFGGQGVDEIFEFDPAILTIDFYSPHIYPSQRSEFETSPGYYNKKLNRIKGEFYWLQNNLPMPWIIGETGFKAQNNFIYPGVDGTLTEQKDYADTTLSLVRQSNGSGYSWWLYQNVNRDPETQGYYGIYNFGQCTPIPCHTNAKPVHEAFENFTPQPPGTLSQPDHYFDPYDHEYYNPDTKHVTGTVLDEYGNPIKDAYILGYTRLYGEGNQGKFYTHYTFTDLNGEFEIIPYDYDSLEPNNNSIENIYISAPGCSRAISSCWECEDGIPDDSTFILSRNELNYQETVAGLDISANQEKVLQAWDKLTLQNVTIQSDGKCEMKARREIQVNTEFQAFDGCEEVWIHTCNTYIPCDSLSPNFLKNSSFVGTDPQEGIKQQKEIQLKFIPVEKEFEFNIYPNPGIGTFTAEINNIMIDGELFLSVYDQFGKEVFSTMIQNEIIQLDLSFLSKGMYIVRISDSENSLCKKIIII